MTTTIRVAPDTVSYSCWQCWWGTAISAVEVHDGKTVAHVSASTSDNKMPPDRMMDGARRDFGMVRAEEDNRFGKTARHLWLELDQGALNFGGGQ